MITLILCIFAGLVVCTMGFAIDILNREDLEKEYNHYKQIIDED